MAIEKIVVVDYEMMIRKALETQLRNKRFSVAFAGDMKGAREILSRDLFADSYRTAIKQKMK